MNWTKSRVDYTPPPDPSRVEAGQIKSALELVGTFNADAFNEIKAQGTVQIALPVANGALGFNPPSLLSVFAGAPYLHSGSARALDDVLENVVHRSAGTGGVDTLAATLQTVRSSCVS